MKKPDGAKRVYSTVYNTPNLLNQEMSTVSTVQDKHLKFIPRVLYC